MEWLNDIEPLAQPPREQLSHTAWRQRKDAEAAAAAAEADELKRAAIIARIERRFVSKAAFNDWRQRKAALLRRSQAERRQRRSVEAEAIAWCGERREYLARESYADWLHAKGRFAAYKADAETELAAEEEAAAAEARRLEAATQQQRAALAKEKLARWRSRKEAERVCAKIQSARRAEEEEEAAAERRDRSELAVSVWAARKQAQQARDAAPRGHDRHVVDAVAQLLRAIG